jgi:anti-sigma B factor antagonist
MNIETIREEGLVTLVVIGYLQADTVGTFRSRFLEETAADSRILLDCTKLEYLDSSGLAAFLTLFKTLSVRQAKLVIYGLSESILRVIYFTKLDRVFTLAENAESAREKVLS